MDKLLAVASEHKALVALLATLVINTGLRFSTSDQWLKTVANHPRLAALSLILKAGGFDFGGVCKAVLALINGKVKP